LPAIAVVCDGAGHALWTIRLAAAAHEIAVDAVDAAPPPAGRAYQLWLGSPRGPRSLGLLPVTGRKVIPEIPALAASLAGSGELLVSLEAARGSDRAAPTGPPIYRAALGRTN
jgi:anti-sigma-K factor RskA